MKKIPIKKCVELVAIAVTCDDTGALVYGLDASGYAYEYQFGSHSPAEGDQPAGWVALSMEVIAPVPPVRDALVTPDDEIPF